MWMEELRNSSAQGRENKDSPWVASFYLLMVVVSVPALPACFSRLLVSSLHLSLSPVYSCPSLLFTAVLASCLHLSLSPVYSCPCLVLTAVLVSCLQLAAVLVWPRVACLLSRLVYLAVVSHLAWLLSRAYSWQLSLPCHVFNLVVVPYYVCFVELSL